MSYLIRNTVREIIPAIRNSPAHCPIFIQIQPFSSSIASVDPAQNGHSFTVNYLINKCGFPVEKAITVSKYVNFKSPENPDSVIAFFCSHGFTRTKASNVIRKVPRVLVSNPEKTLLPKLEFFKSKGVSSEDVVKILSKEPALLKTGLENQIIPSFEFVKNLIGSEEKTLTAIKHSPGSLLVNPESRMAPNVHILREVGVPDENIAFMLTYYPRPFTRKPESFKRVVEEVTEFGYSPMRVYFVVAIRTLCSMSKPTWKKKIEVYKRWGLSEDEILVTFGKNPWFMAASEDKIMKIMDYLVNKMGLHYSFVLTMPSVLTLSFEKRIVPRCLVYQALQAKGLIKKPKISLKMLRSTEMLFVQKVANLAKEEAPEILKLYKEKMAIAR